MSDSSEVEIEEYEETIGDLNYSPPHVNRPATPAAGVEVELDSLPFNEPISQMTSVEAATSFQHITHCPRSDPSSNTQLAGASLEPRRPVAVAATLV